MLQLELEHKGAGVMMAPPGSLLCAGAREPVEIFS